MDPIIIIIITHLQHLLKKTTQFTMLTISLFTNVIHNPPRVPSMYFIPLIIVLPYNQNFNQNYMTFN